MLEKTDKAGIWRDTRTGALITKNPPQLSAYKLQKQRARESREMYEKSQEVVQSFASLKNEIVSLRKELEDVKKENAKFKLSINKQMKTLKT
jgi:hypothetical protein